MKLRAVFESRVDDAHHDMRAITNMSDRAARKLATSLGHKNLRGWSAGEIAHAVVKKGYGDRVYAAARKKLFSKR